MEDVELKLITKGAMALLEISSGSQTIVLEVDGCAWESKALRSENKRRIGSETSLSGKAKRFEVK